MNHSHLPPTSAASPDDLRAEQAFRYVAGELTGAELDTFERQLNTDQTTREAVAAAVEWTHSVWTCERSTSAPHAQQDSLEPTVAGRPHSPVTVALATAGLLLLALSLVPLLRPSDSRSNRHAATASPEQQLALAWNRVRQDSPALVNAADDPLEVVEDDADADTNTADNSASALPGEEVESPPSWIMAAVSAVAEHQTGPPSTPNPAQDHEEL